MRKVFPKINFVSPFRSITGRRWSFRVESAVVEETIAPTHMFSERFYAHQMFPTPPRDSCNRVYREKRFNSVHWSGGCVGAKQNIELLQHLLCSLDTYLGFFPSFGSSFRVRSFGTTFLVRRLYLSFFFALCLRSGFVGITEHAIHLPLKCD